MFERLTKQAMELSKKDRKSTLSARSIQSAVKLLLPGELSKHAVTEAVKAVTKFEKYAVV